MLIRRIFIMPKYPCYDASSRLWRKGLKWNYESACTNVDYCNCKMHCTNNKSFIHLCNFIIADCIPISVKRTLFRVIKMNLKFSNACLIYLIVKWSNTHVNLLGKCYTLLKTRIQLVWKQMCFPLPSHMDIFLMNHHTWILYFIRSNVDSSISKI